MLSTPLPMRTMIRSALNFSRSSLVNVIVCHISAPTASFNTWRHKNQLLIKPLLHLSKTTDLLVDLRCALSIAKRNRGHVFQDRHFNGAIATVQQCHKRSAVQWSCETSSTFIYNTRYEPTKTRVFIADDTLNAVDTQATLAYVDRAPYRTIQQRARCKSLTIKLKTVTPVVYLEPPR